MNDRMQGAIARSTDAISRRGSIRMLAGTTLAGAAAAPQATRAAKAGKQARKRCTRQQAACEEVVQATCQDNVTCLNALFPCCAFLATCNGGEATRCFLSG